jgi:hypothetical protein
MLLRLLNQDDMTNIETKIVARNLRAKTYTKGLSENTAYICELTIMDRNLLILQLAKL